jgi:holo-[acyl-carrier protein] synthase
MSKIGLDVQCTSEVRESLVMFGSRYTRRLFTDYEVEECRELTANAANHYAERFAAKEAVLKVLNVQDVIPSWKDIEIRRKTTCQFEVVLYGKAAELAYQQGVRSIALSVSHVADVATAVVVAD